MDFKRYSCAIDVWSMACIIAEMATGRPLFHGGSEIDQLFKIFQRLGTPDENCWPKLYSQPSWNSNFPIWHPNLRNYLRNFVDIQCIDLLEVGFDNYCDLNGWNLIFSTEMVKGNNEKYYYYDLNKCIQQGNQEKIKYVLLILEKLIL